MAMTWKKTKSIWLSCLLLSSLMTLGCFSNTAYARDYGGEWTRLFQRLTEGLKQNKKLGANSIIEVSSISDHLGRENTCLPLQNHFAQKIHTSLVYQRNMFGGPVLHDGHSEQEAHLFLTVRWELLAGGEELQLTLSILEKEEESAGKYIARSSIDIEKAWLPDAVKACFDLSGYFEQPAPCTLPSDLKISHAPPMRILPSGSLTSEVSEIFLGSATVQQIPSFGIAKFELRIGDIKTFLEAYGDKLAADATRLVETTGDSPFRFRNITREHSTSTQMRSRRSLGIRAKLEEQLELPVSHMKTAYVERFLQFLRKKTGRDFRYVTKTEWLYALTGPFALSGIDNLKAVKDCSTAYTLECLQEKGPARNNGSHRCNPWRICNLIGNLAEYTSDGIMGYDWSTPGNAITLEDYDSGGMALDDIPWLTTVRLAVTLKDGEGCHQRSE
ncbi:MAG: hypothetical protein ABW168_08210 [Sedimenticola sp.]